MIFSTSFPTNQEVLHSMCCGSGGHLGVARHRPPDRVVRAVRAAGRGGGGGGQGGPHQGKDDSSAVPGNWSAKLCFDSVHPMSWSRQFYSMLNVNSRVFW